MDFHSEATEIPDGDALNRLLEELRARVIALDLTITPRTDDPFLTKFLNAKNYVVEEALKSVKRYYANVKRNLDFIKGIRPSDFTDTFLNGPFFIFKHWSKGRRIGAIQLSKWKPKVHSLRDVQLTAVLMAEHALWEPEMQKKGFVIIFDLKGLSFEQIRYATPRELKRILLTGQEGLPIKVSEVHIVNPPPFYWSVHAISMRFVKEKIRKRIHIHYNHESLHEFLDAGICPASLGGTLSENEARDYEGIDYILRKNILYEDMWNGDRNYEKQYRKLGRKRSSAGDVVYTLA